MDAFKIMFPAIKKSLAGKVCDNLAHSARTQILDDEKENIHGSAGVERKKRTHKVVQSRLSGEKLTNLKRSEHPLTEIKNDSERFSGGVLGSLEAPTLSEYYRKNSINRSRIRRRGTEDVKLPQIKNLTLSNNDTKRNTNKTCPKESPQFLCNASNQSSPGKHEIYGYATDTVSSATTRSFASQGSNNESIDSGCKQPQLGLIPSAIFNSPCSTVSKLDAPSKLKSFSTPYSSHRQHTDFSESVNHDDSFTIDNSVSVYDVTEDNNSTPQSTTSSKISIFIPKNRKSTRNMNECSTDIDDSEYEEWEDEDSQCSDGTSKHSYIDDESDHTKEGDSNHIVVDENFFGQTIVAKMRPNFSPRNKVSFRDINEHSTDSCSGKYDRIHNFDSDTEIELTDDDSCPRNKKNPTSKNEKYQDQIINITSTTASLTISSGQNSKNLSENSSRQGSNPINEEHSDSDTVVLDESTICESIIEEIETLESPKKKTDGFRLNSINTSCHISGVVTTNAKKSTETSSGKNIIPYFNSHKLNTKNKDTSKTNRGIDHSSKVSSNKEPVDRFENLREKMMASPLKKGKWTLGPKIGVGTFGVVHMGMNSLTGKLMAVKKLGLPDCASSNPNNDILQDLHSEIELMRSLGHVNIVRYLGAEVTAKKNVIFIFQEWIPGGSIASLLRKFGPFSIRVVSTYLKQILTGLEYLHSCRILHRDIKGGNILVNDQGVVKLADFGASIRMGEHKHISEEDFDNITENMTVKGTPYFMAPEVFEEICGPKADVWSVGGVVFQMITGDPPWKNMDFRSPSSLFRHLKKTEGPPQMNIPPQLNGDNDTRAFDEIASLQLILEKCFHRDPKKRPSASILLKSLCLAQTDARGSASCTGESSDNEALHTEEIFPCNSRKDECQGKMKTSASILSPTFTRENWPDWAIR